MVQGSGQAGAIEITPAMIEAGVATLREAGRLSLEADGLDHLLVQNILEEALARSPRAARAA